MMYSPSKPIKPSAGHRSPKAGFTLVEVLMVIMIIGVLTGLVLGVAGFANKKSAISKSEALHQQLLFGLENFKAEWGDYPKGDFNKMFAMLYKDPVVKYQREPYVEINETDIFPKIPNTKDINFSGTLYVSDAWGQTFVYTCPGTQNPSSFDLYSKGPDLKTGGAFSADDISNY